MKSDGTEQETGNCAEIVRMKHQLISEGVLAERLGEYPELFKRIYGVLFRDFPRDFDSLEDALRAYYRNKKCTGSALPKFMQHPIVGKVALHQIQRALSCLSHKLERIGMKKAIQGVHEIIELTARQETTESEVMQALEAVRKEFNSSKTKIKAYVHLLFVVGAKSKHICSSDSEDCDSP